MWWFCKEASLDVFFFVFVFFLFQTFSCPSWGKISVDFLFFFWRGDDVVCVFLSIVLQVLIPNVDRQFSPGWGRVYRTYVYDCVYHTPLGLLFFCPRSIARQPRGVPMPNDTYGFGKLSARCCQRPTSLVAPTLMYSNCCGGIENGKIRPNGGVIFLYTPSTGV